MNIKTKGAVPEQVREYLSAVLDKDRGRAIAVVERMFESKKALWEIFGVLTAAQVEIGEMWSKGIVSVADEHFATETTLQSIDIVSERFRRPTLERRGLAFLCTIEGEYHLVGIRMFSELLRNQGWETIILGSSITAKSLIERAKALGTGRVDLLCISATMPSCLSLLVDTIKKLRAEPAYARTKIILGGPAFRSRAARNTLSQGLATSGPADYMASDYESALEFTGSL